MTNPGFYHETVLLKEATDGLAIKQNGVYVDATFGGGGHSKVILQQLGPDGKLVGFDQDEDAWRNAPTDERLIPVKENFRYLKRFLRLNGINEVDGVLADLGVSSYQFDTAERGFSIRMDGPLDMRMDKRGELTASAILRTYEETALHKLFERYGEVRNAKQLAKQIIGMRKRTRWNTTGELKAAIDPVIWGNPNRYLAQVFQALRMEVNDEEGALKEFLQQATAALKPGGRLSVISFHSLEDRIVKHWMKRGKWEENEVAERSQLVMLNSKPIEPTPEETKRNPRSRSARLRVAEKVHE